MANLEELSTMSSSNANICSAGCRIKSQRQKQWTTRLVFGIVLIAAPIQSMFAQRMQIDSLRKKIALSAGTEKVDCLNRLSTVYLYLNQDSATKLSERAQSLAQTISYPKGILAAVNNLAHAAGKRGDFSLQEQICKRALALATEINDLTGLADTHLNLALAKFYQGKFSEAVEICDKVVKLSGSANIRKELGEAIALKASLSFENGDYEKAFTYLNESLQIFNALNDTYNTAIILAKTGDLYQLAGDQGAALNYYYQSLEYPKSDLCTWHPLADLGDTFTDWEMFDPAMVENDGYMQSIKALTIQSNPDKTAGLTKAEEMIAGKKYREARLQLQKEIKNVQEDRSTNAGLRAFLDMTKVLAAEKKTAGAISYARKLVKNASERGARQYQRDGYQQLSVLYGIIGNTDSSYHYFKKFTIMKDSVGFFAFTKKLALHRAALEDERKRGQIELLNREKDLGRQELQLSTERLKTESLKKNILLGSVLLLLLLGIVIGRNIHLQKRNEAARREVAEKELIMQRLESEKERFILQQRAAELEMQALRAQINPHFIFNCLNAINRFTVGNDPEKASDYLTRFSKLIRSVLEQSGKSFVLLEDEIDFLRLYIDLENIRFEQPFTYQLHFEAVDASSILVPPLIIQPFIENAIWHGLQPKPGGQGRIDIHFRVESDVLLCTIHDNGVGRQKPATEKRTGKSSMGIQLTKDRLQLLQTQTGKEAAVTIVDLADESGNNEGTSVTVKIPVNGN